MQTCSRCNASSPDTAQNCVNCKAELKEYSASAVALKKFKANPRVTAVRIAADDEACPLCYESVGTFAKDAVPALPHEGCSSAGGCRCKYEPVLNDIYP